MAVGGPLAALGHWVLAPALVLVVGGGLALMVVLTRLCTPTALRALALVLLFPLLLAVPILGIDAVQDTVLAARGVSHQGAVSEVRVVHGKTTTYTCEVRYDDRPDRTHAVTCTDQYHSGDRVQVSEDPAGWVEPQFTDLVQGSSFTRAFALVADAALLVLALAAGLLGLLHHAWASRRAARRSAGGPSAASSAGRQGGEGAAGDLPADPE
jgi:hypothetical protein